MINLPFNIKHKQVNKNFKYFFVYSVQILLIKPYRISAHGSEVRGKGKEGQSVEKGPVDDAVRQILGG